MTWKNEKKNNVFTFHVLNVLYTVAKGTSGIIGTRLLSWVTVHHCPSPYTFPLMAL